MDETRKIAQLIERDYCCPDCQSPIEAMVEIIVKHDLVSETDRIPVSEAGQNKEDEERGIIYPVPGLRFLWRCTNIHCAEGQCPRSLEWQEGSVLELKHPEVDEDTKNWTRTKANARA